MRSFDIPNSVELCLLDVVPVMELLAMPVVLSQEEVPKSVARRVEFLYSPGGSFSVDLDDFLL